MQPGSANYGGMPIGYMPSPSAFAPGKRRKINALAVCVNIFLPWFLFSALYGMMSFKIHYEHPALVWVVYALGFIVPVVTGVLALIAKRREMDLPMWYTFSALTFTLAVIFAGVFGDLNFWYNMEPFYDLMNLNTYPAVDPANWQGQQLMDSGRVYFASGTILDTQRAMAFKNHDLYCVAPIVNKNNCDKLPTYDFWAVGVNCCNGDTPTNEGWYRSDFKCGEYNNPNARSGLRLMKEEQRPFFRLAVQQAEAAYNLKASHPIFFYWMQDPVDAVHAYRNDGFKYYLWGIFAHFGFNLFCVVCAVIAFSKIGQRAW